MQICSHCLSLYRFSLFVKCGQLTCLPCLDKYYKLNCNYKFKVRCPACKHFGSFDKIHTYIVPTSRILTPFFTRMFKESLLVCAHVGCGQMFSLDTINYDEL